MEEIRLSIEGVAGTSNYNNLFEKPRINGVTLEGDKESPELFLQGVMDSITEQMIDKMIYGGNENG